MGDEGSARGLPRSAQDRMAEMSQSGTWGSALSTSEFAALRSVGFEPAGPGGWNAGYMGAPVPVGLTRVSSQGGYGSYAPLTQAMYTARHTAISRMTDECATLGGHGVVGVTLTFGPFPLGGLEFKAIGTAVRGIGARAPRTPFSSDLSGQEFAKLIMAGWVPAGLALGISIASRHDDWITMGQARWGAGNAEVGGYTELVNMARHDARVRLAADVAKLGGEGVVISGNELRIRERECPAQEHRRDHIAEATFIGTAIARFTSRATRPAPGSLAILSLDPRRRQAARVRLGA